MSVGDVLQSAYDLLTGDRNDDYGDTTRNFDDISVLWTHMLRDKLKSDMTITPQDVALLMIELKALRAVRGPQKMDSWVDLAGYAAIGGSFIDD